MSSGRDLTMLLAVQPLSPITAASGRPSIERVRGAVATRARRLGGPAALLLAAAALSGCGGGGDSEPSGTPATGNQAASGPGPPPPGQTFNRSCRSAVRPVGRPPRPRDLVVGPVTFYTARALAMGDPADLSRERRPPGGWAALKALIEVEPEVSATVVIPPRHRDSLLLIYRSFTDRIGESSYFRRSAGDTAVRFDACSALAEGRGPAYNGGFLVREPGCYEVEVFTENDPEPARAALGLVVGRRGVCPFG